MAVRYEEGVADGVTEDARLLPRAAVRGTRPERAPSGRRSASRDLMATNHLAITDETFDGLREHFSEPEIVELCMNVALFVGFGRMGAALHMVDDLPEHFQGEGEERVTPWGSEEQVLIAELDGELVRTRRRCRTAADDDGLRRRRSSRSATSSWAPAARAPENVVLAFPDARATAAELLAAATATAHRGCMPSACAAATGWES